MAFDADQAKYDRMNRLHKPEFAPSQELGGADMSNDPFGNSSDPFGSPSGGGFGAPDPFGSPSGGGFGAPDPFGSPSGGSGAPDPFGSPAGGGFGAPDPFGGIGMGTMGGMQQQQPQQQKSAEDKFADGVVKGSKATVGFVKEFVQSIGQTTPLYWVNYGHTVLITSAVVLGLGIILKLFGVSSGLSISIGACLSAIIGIGCWLFPLDNAKNYQSEYKDEESSTSQDMSDMMGGNDDLFGDMGGSSDAFGSSESGNDNFFNSSSDDMFGGSSDDSYDSSDDSDEEYDDDYEEEEEEYSWNVEPQPEQGLSTEDALNSLPEIQQGTYTRQYLYEMFQKVLPKITPNYDSVQQIDEDDDEFLQWGEYLRDSALATGMKEEDLPELTSLERNIFTMKMESTRPKGIKVELVGTELAKLYAYKEYNEGRITEEEMEAIYCKSDAIGMKCIFTIYTGKTPMVSLKDLMVKEDNKKWLLNTDNFMPVIFGINEKGKTIRADLKKVESIIIAGMPRSGKTWLAQAVLTQMCAFVPPSELNIFVCDPKGPVSDFKKFYLPHVKKFVSEDAKIIATLDYVINDLAPKRKKLIGDAGFVNIWDYKKANPTVSIPSVIYVVMDELVTLAERMDKDTKSHFQKQLITIITQFPNLGIRVFLVPHVIKNDIISKTATDTVEARISVRGDAGHIEQTTGAKPNQFKYKIPNTGDMAVYIKQISQNVFYSHGVILTSSNPENDNLFDYLRQVWTKLEPEQVKGSRAEVGSSEKENQSVLDNLDKMEDEVISFDDNSSEISSTSEVFTNNNDKGLSSFNTEEVKKDSTDDSDDDLFNFF